MGEDGTDVATLEVLLRRMIPRTVGVTRRAPPQGRGGCAKLRRAAKAYLQDFQRSGCSLAILLHDLDLSGANNELNDERRLRRELEAIPVPPGLERLVCIPVEELEAWFWSDQALLDRIGDNARALASPHTLKKPKEKLMALSWRSRRGYSTNDNPELARILDLDICARRCPAFAELREAVVRHCGP